MDNSRKRGEDAPGDERTKDQPGGASFACDSRARHLKRKIAEEKKRPKQRGLLAGDVQRLSQPGSGAESVIGPVDIGEAVGDEDRRQ